MEVKKEKKELTDKAQNDYYWVRKAVEDNDQKAFTVLMERYRNSVFHTILKMVHNQNDAEDLTLEAFAKAFDKLSSYTPSFAFSTWLFRIAVNNTIDHLRKKKLHLLSIDDTINNEGDDEYSSLIKSNILDPEQEFISGQKVKLMRAVLGKLDPKYRLMIEMRFFEEMSYEDISKEVGIPLGTVKAQLFRAKEILYQILKDSNPKAYMDIHKKNKK